MKRCSILVLILLVSCTFQSPAQPSAVTDRPTGLVLVPTPTTSPTPTSTSTPTTSPTPTSTSTPTPSSTPTTIPSPTASPTALPFTSTMTTTAMSQLANLTLCNQEFGPRDIARFSARFQRLEVQQLPLLDQLTFVLSDVKGDLHGSVGCVGRTQWERATLTTATGDTMLAVSLDDWGHDQAFAVSPITDTLPLTISGALTAVSFVPTKRASRGLTIGIGLRQMRPYRVRLDVQPDRLIVEVTRSASSADTPDPLGQAAGEINPPDSPIFFLQNNDVWRWSQGQAAPVVKTDELETALAISPDRETLAVCRAPAGTDAAALPYAARSTLWVLRADGGQARELADVGGCADLAFARDGKTLAFTANTASSPPAKLSVWTVPLVVGEAVPATVTNDEWNRYAPQWLADGRLIYRARNESGQTVIFLRDIDGQEHEITAALLTGAQYSGVGQFLLNPEDSTLAVEVFRNDKPGADLVVLRLDGTEVSADGRGYWQRPLAWTPSGLVYLTTECPSAVVQQYTLRRRRGVSSEDLLSGESVAALGDIVPFDTQLLYLRIATPQGGNRGPQPVAEDNMPVALWIMASDGKLRHQLYAAPVSITNVQGR